VIFGPAALILETKKPRAGWLARPRLELPFSYSLLRRSSVNLRADLAIIPIIIVVVTKYAHFCLSSGVHASLHNWRAKMPRTPGDVKQKVLGQWVRRRSKSYGGTVASIVGSHE